MPARLYIQIVIQKTNKQTNNPTQHALIYVSLVIADPAYKGKQRPIRMRSRAQYWGVTETLHILRSDWLVKCNAHKIANFIRGVARYVQNVESTRISERRKELPYPYYPCV